jgi:hypothetical protein
VDFTLRAYKILLMTLLRQGYSFVPIKDSFTPMKNRTIILRQDVDLNPENSLNFARFQAQNNIKSVYYFRIVPESYNEAIIKEIYSLGHEIGYHYEDMSLTTERQMTSLIRKKGVCIDEYEKYLAGIAMESFAKNLGKLRKIVPIKTICMHGSPISRWDSRLLWKYYDYRDIEIVTEPYFNLNFENILYITDTGRTWNGIVFSVRDKALGTEYGTDGEDRYRNWMVKPIPGSLMNMTQESTNFQKKYKFRSTFDIIEGAKKGELPDKIMMTFHPQRWTEKPLPWIKELVWQNVKNTGKYFLIKIRK